MQNSMTMSEMLALGAPALPDDLYYRVRSDTLANFYVAIMKPRAHMWDKKLAEYLGREYVRNKDDQLVKLSPKDAIRNTAIILYEDVFKTRPAFQSWWEELRSLEGDHK